MLKNYKSFIAVMALVAVVGFGVATPVAHANPSYFAPTAQTATATTSVAYVGTGTATSTLSYDSYTNNANNGRFKANSAALVIQFAGSSTASVLGINLEYSQDGIDWYRDFLLDVNSRSTTSPAINLTTANSISWTFASTTVGGIAKTNANSATSTAVVMVPTPLRFVRAVFSMTGGAGAVWGQFIPVKQQI